MIEAARELDCFNAYIRLREPNKSEDKAESMEVGGRKERESDDESKRAQLPKSKALVRNEVESEEYRSVAEADLLVAKKGSQMQGNR
ncbi:hypothetical protein BHM03_00013641 [Ensete ventricosum]|nr:hypothetical protein BHM03_00013641 [Ensete ventricosum]